MDIKICENENKIIVAQPDITDESVTRFGVRHKQAILFFAYIALAYMIRSHLGITIVAMTSSQQENYYDSKLSKDMANETTLNRTFGNSWFISKHNFGGANRIYNWTKSNQEMALNSFHFGYAIMMIPMSVVGHKWGPVLSIKIGLLANGLVSLPAPWLFVWGSWKALCFCRIVQGMTQAGLIPGVVSLIAKWIPFSEQGRIINYVLAGQSAGTVFSYQLSSVLAGSSLGWPSIYWSTGALSLIGFVLVSLYGVNSPSDHKSISTAEKKIILAGTRVSQKRRDVPWRAILTSRPAAAAFITHSASGVVFMFYLNQMPSYLHHVLSIDVRSSGLLSSLPYIGNVFGTIAFGIITDYCISRRFVGVANMRRLCNSVGEFGIAGCLVAVSFATNTSPAIAFFILAMTTYAGINTGWWINYIDLAPNYAGVLLPVGNSFMNVAILMTPVLVSFVVVDMKNQYEWRIAMVSVAAVAAVCNVVFVALMSADVQPWNDYGYQAPDAVDKKRKTTEEH